MRIAAVISDQLKIQHKDHFKQQGASAKEHFHEEVWTIKKMYLKKDVFILKRIISIFFSSTWWWPIRRMRITTLQRWWFTAHPWPSATRDRCSNSTRSSSISSISRWRRRSENPCCCLCTERYQGFIKLTKIDIYANINFQLHLQPINSSLLDELFAMPAIGCPWVKPPKCSEDDLLPRPLSMNEIVKKVKFKMKENQGLPQKKVHPFFFLKKFFCQFDQNLNLLICSTTCRRPRCRRRIPVNSRISELQNTCSSSTRFPAKCPCRRKQSWHAFMTTIFR